MINIYLCEDDKKILLSYSQLIEKIAKEYRQQVDVKTYTSGEELLLEIEEKVGVIDIIYLDIEMCQMNGIDTALELRKLGCKAEIIYLTSIKEYVFDTFVTEPLNYLIKQETDEQKFREVFLKAIEKVKKEEKDYFVVRSASRILKIDTERIKYFEVIKRKIYIYCDKEVFEFYGTLDGILEELARERFIKIHRAFIININYIKCIEKNELELITGDKLSIGRKYLQKVKDVFEDSLYKDIL